MLFRGLFRTPTSKDKLFASLTLLLVYMVLPYKVPISGYGSDSSLHGSYNLSNLKEKVSIKIFVYEVYMNNLLSRTNKQQQPLITTICIMYYGCGF